MMHFKAGHHRHKMHHHHRHHHNHSRHHRAKRKVQSARTRPLSSGLTVLRSPQSAVNSAKVMACESVAALFVFSETKMSSMAALLHSAQWLGLDLAAQREHEMERVQRVLFDHERSPKLHHLTVADVDSVDGLLIPNRVRSLVVQRGFSTLCDVQFESQFFPYSISCTHRGAERLDYFLSLCPLSRRLHALSPPDGGRAGIDALSSSDDEVTYPSV